MSATPIHFFTETYAPDFWQQHSIIVDTDGRLASVPRRGHPGLVGDAAIDHRPAAQHATRNMLDAQMAAFTPPAELGALMTASRNVAAFSDAFPALRPPLMHPALRASLPPDMRIAQLAYELEAVELASCQQRADYETHVEQSPPETGSGIAFASFLAVAEERCIYDLLRVETMYEDLRLPLRGAHTYLSVLLACPIGPALWAGGTFARDTAELLQVCRRLKREVQDDLDRLECFYSRAAPIMQQALGDNAAPGTPSNSRWPDGTAAPAASPGLVDDASMKVLLTRLCAERGDSPVRTSLPNLFGPGQLMRLSAVQTHAYARLCGQTVSQLNELRRTLIGPLAAQLQKVTAQALSLYRRRPRRTHIRQP